MKRVRGWSNIVPSKCAAAHYVLEANSTEAFCGAPIRTLVPTKQHPREICDWCQHAARRGVR